jgi:HK97 family phage major capsid protein
LTTGGAAATFPVALGDWRRAYVMADRVGLRVTVEDNITSPGYIKYFFRKRVDGISYNVNAAKFLRTAAYV